MGVSEHSLLQITASTTQTGLNNMFSLHNLKPGCLLGSQSLPSGIGLSLDSSCCGGDQDGVSVPQEHEPNVRTVGIPEKKWSSPGRKGEPSPTQSLCSKLFLLLWHIPV